MNGARLFPNVGAEEAWDATADAAAGPTRRVAMASAAVVATARLWRGLFGADAIFEPSPVDSPGDSSMDSRVESPLDSSWPTALGPAPEGPALRGLEASEPLYAWLNTPAAANAAARLGRPLFGASPEVVRVVHDKAFALDVARRERRVPAPISACIEVLAPELLRDAEQADRFIAERVSRWPDWTGGRFTLKPRLGTSGRGRAAGTGADCAPVRGAFGRLADAGGALLEPWLERVADLSAQLWIEPDGGLRLLGTTELLVSPAGVYRGHRGWVDSKGRVTTGSAFDETLREAAVEVAQAASAAGYWGPCGVDAFAFRLPPDRVVLRPIVELNARFTLGTVAIGVLRRWLPRIRSQLALAPEERRAFHFALAAPEAGWSLPGVEGIESSAALLDARDGIAPGLALAADFQRLDHAFGDEPGLAG